MTIKVRKLESVEERLQAERLICTAFLHEWEEKEAKVKAVCPAGEVWGAFDEKGNLISAVDTLRHEMTYEGRVISCGELHMVGTLPQARGEGAVRCLIEHILREYKARGDLFATLIPFSFQFYRWFGFELASEMLIQRVGIEQFAPFTQKLKARQILCQEDVDRARRLYENYIRGYNLADLKTQEDWTYREYGEFGTRDWQHMDKTHYSYLFEDEQGKARAYFTFVFVHGPKGPFTGSMKVIELIFDGPEALHSVFGFFYGMRAKIEDVRMETPRDMDFGRILPEPDSVKRKLDSHYTARVLNIQGVLEAMRHPAEEGHYVIQVLDMFLTENTGSYAVTFGGGNCQAKRCEGKVLADLEVTVDTFCQLAVGLIDLKASLYRVGTKLNGNRGTLEKVFVQKPLLLG